MHELVNIGLCFTLAEVTSAVEDIIAALTDT